MIGSTVGGAPVVLAAWSLPDVAGGTDLRSFSLEVLVVLGCVEREDTVHWEQEIFSVQMAQSPKR